MMVFVVAVILILSFLRSGRGVEMAVRIVAEPCIDGHMHAPVGMDADVGMEMIQAHGVAEEPDVAGSEVIILIADDADVFVAIPDIGIGHHIHGRDRRRGRLHDGRRGSDVNRRGRGDIDGWRRGHDDARGRDDNGFKCHAAIRTDDAAGDQYQTACQQGQDR